MKINPATGVTTRRKVTTMMTGDIVTKTKNIRVGTRPVPADGFYEWKKVVGGKIPYSIGMKDDSPTGLWEGWKDPFERSMAAYLHDHHGRTE